MHVLAQVIRLCSALRDAGWPLAVAVEMVGMQSMNSYLLQNLNQILASGMGGPLAGMLGQFAQVPPWAQKGLWPQQDKVRRPINIKVYF